MEYTIDAPTSSGAVWKTFWGTSGNSIEPDHQGAWRTEIILPKTDKDGNKVYYRIRPEKLNLYKTDCKVPQYTMDPNGNDNDNTICKIVNTYTDSWNYSIDLSWDKNMYEKM